MPGPRALGLLETESRMARAGPSQGLKGLEHRSAQGGLPGRGGGSFRRVPDPAGDRVGGVRHGARVGALQREAGKGVSL